MEEGDDVTLHANVATQNKNMDQLLWFFKTTPIAESTKTGTEFCNDELFNGRLNLDLETGDLTVRNTSKPHNGYYKLQINSILSRCWGFSVTVYGE